MRSGQFDEAARALRSTRRRAMAMRRLRERCRRCRRRSRAPSCVVLASWTTKCTKCRHACPRICLHALARDALSRCHFVAVFSRVRHFTGVDKRSAAPQHLRERARRHPLHRCFHSNLRAEQDELSHAEPGRDESSCDEPSCVEAGDDGWWNVSVVAAAVPGACSPPSPFAPSPPSPLQQTSPPPTSAHPTLPRPPYPADSAPLCAQRLSWQRPRSHHRRCPPAHSCLLFLGHSPLPAHPGCTIPKPPCRPPQGPPAASSGCLRRHRSTPNGRSNRPSSSQPISGCEGGGRCCVRSICTQKRSLDSQLTAPRSHPARSSTKSRASWVGAGGFFAFSMPAYGLACILRGWRGRGFLFAFREAMCVHSDPRGTAGVGHGCTARDLDRTLKEPPVLKAVTHKVAIYLI